jgi:hypothetical protein
LTIQQRLEGLEVARKRLVDRYGAARPELAPLVEEIVAFRYENNEPFVAAREAEELDRSLTAGAAPGTAGWSEVLASRGRVAFYRAEWAGRAGRTADLHRALADADRSLAEAARLGAAKGVANEALLRTLGLLLGVAERRGKDLPEDLEILLERLRSEPSE